MTDPKDNVSQRESKHPTPPEATNAISGFALLTYNTLHHNWLSDSDRTDTLDWTFEHLEACLKQTPELVLRVTDNTLHANGAPVTEQSERLARLLRHMRDIKTDNMSFKPGLTREELENYLEVFTARPNELDALGGFAHALAECGIEHVTCKTIVYVAVSDDEVVVEKSDIKKKEEAATRVAEVEKNLEEITAILAHLKGEHEAGPVDTDTDVVNTLRDMASDTQRLAELVFQAAAEKGKAREKADGIMADVLEAVHRAFQAIQTDPATRTQKGSREAARKLNDLENALLALVDKHDDIADADTCKAEIEAASQNAAEAVKRDALASEYLRRLRAMQKTESRLQRYLKRAEGNSDTQLKERLLDDGMTPEQWHQLMGRPRDSASSGAGQVGLDNAEITHAVGRLGALLFDLKETVTDLVHDREGSAEQLARQSTEVSDLVATTAGDAGDKMRSLASSLEADADAVRTMEARAQEQGIALQVTRERMLESLQEISQEICQPVAVIQSTVDLVAAGNVGELNDSQHSLMQLAAESSHRLSKLLEDLRGLVGSPETLAPDREMLDTLSKRIG